MLLIVYVLYTYYLKQMYNRYDLQMERFSPRRLS